MELRTKQRLIGAMVLAGVVLLILPFLFHDKQPSPSVNLATTIPNPPAAPEIQVAIPDQQSATGSVAQNASAPNSTSVAQNAPSVTSQAESNHGQASANSAQNPIQSAQTSSQAVAQNSAQNAQTSSPIAEQNSAKNSLNSAQSITNAAQNTAPNASSSAATTTPKTAPLATQTPANPQFASNKIDHSPTAAAPASATPSLVKAAKGSPAAKASPAALAQWTIQVGAFSSHKNASQLLAKLRAHGFEAYVKTNGKQLATVYVGPESNHQKTVALQQKLKQSLKLSGVIRKYQS